MAIRWKRVSGFDYYLISSDGQVWSDYTNRVLSPEIDKDGYEKVLLCKNGIAHHQLVHRLVAIAFLPAPGKGKKLVAHKNGIPNDNRYSNLYWATHKDNSDDRSRHGRTYNGEVHHLSKLRRHDIPKIRSLVEKGESDKSIAERFDVTSGTIWHIRKGITWKTA